MRKIHYSEVEVSLHKGIKRTSVQRAKTWVIGGHNTLGGINKDKDMIRQIESRVYPKNYKGVRKLIVVNIFLTKSLGDSFYYR